MVDEVAEDSNLKHEIEVERLADEVVQRGLGSVLLFFLEAHRPLRGMLYHAATFSSPLFVPFFGTRNIERFMKVMESDAAVEKLIHLIEVKSRAPAPGRQ